MPFEKLKEIVQRWMWFVLFRSFEMLSLWNKHWPGHATVFCDPSWKITIQVWCCSKMMHLTNLLTFIFLVTGFGVMNEFCGHHACAAWFLPVLMLRILFTRPLWPPLMKWGSELLLRLKQLHCKCWENTWRKTEHWLDNLICHEKGLHVEIV